jgi:hypothetical protein
MVTLRKRIPRHARIRFVPMHPARRLTIYCAQNRSMRPTPRQNRRIKHKTNRLKRDL